MASRPTNKIKQLRDSSENLPKIRYDPSIGPVEQGASCDLGKIPLFAWPRFYSSDGMRNISVRADKRIGCEIRRSAAPRFPTTLGRPAVFASIAATNFWQTIAPGLSSEDWAWRSAYS